MIEFDSLCYLQNQKTGCTFIERFLRRFCVEKVRRYAKHSVIKKARPGVFYFVNVREPLDAYSSLFRFGLDGKGEIFMRLKAAGHGELYARGLDGFEWWLRFVLETRNARLLMPGVPPVLSAQLGLKSWRYLRLAVPEIMAGAGSMTSAGEIRKFVARNTRVNHVIRYERLTDELLILVDGPLSHAFADRAAIAKWIEDAPRINASSTAPAALHSALSPDLLSRLHDREWFLYEAFYGSKVDLNMMK